MFAAFAQAQSPTDPLSGLVVADITTASPPEGWVRVKVVAASVNHHDLWSLRGVGLAAHRLPMVLGCDGAGVDDDGNEVIVHAVISSPEWTGDDTEDPNRCLLSEVHPGTMAEYVYVPQRNLVKKPAEFTFEQAACLPTAWLTAYRMLFTKAKLRPRETVLIQGVSGGVATAAIALAKASGVRVWATTRNPANIARAVAVGADEVFETGARLPERVDAVIDSVGAATWAHSLKVLRPAGRLITCGATSGSNPPAELNRVFFLQLQVLGSTMGTRQELVQLLRFCVSTGVRPVIDRTLPLAEAREGFAALADAETFGKVVLTV